MSVTLPKGGLVDRNINIQLEGGVLPTRATNGSAGYDLYAADDAVVFPGDKPVLVSAGFRVSMPSGKVMLVCSRSGLSTKGVVVANAPGIVDSDFRGVVKVILTATNGLTSTFEIKKGDRIAQALFMDVPNTELTLVESVDQNTSRGTGGFGSTGK